jgi:UDP-N-acetylglucosamine--N-acetylmuramyl-(pentapeptide) pyrophosphoryl-undecaprenol N-acetylglucosamine transferase
MSTGSPSIVIAAGGTGGHIYPGLALAAALRAVAPDASISFVGTPKGLEGELIPKAGFELDLYDMVQFNSQGWRKVLAPVALVRSSLQARRILRRRRATVAVTMGGYSGIPIVIGARLARVPALVHEPGAVPGQANRLAARFTRHVATSFPQTTFSGRTPRHVGYPLQGFITDFDRDALRPEARAAFGLDDDTALVLVNGGSQGSLVLNKLALGLAERWRERTDVRILVKTGATTHDDIVRELESNPGRSLVDAIRYLDRIDHAYAAADVGIHRAGAGTVSELAAVGLPSILVPLPHHEHDEQAHNAKPLVDAGGALMVRDPDAVAGTVGPMIEDLLADRARLAAMRTALQVTARPDAATDLARWVLELAGTA